MQFVDASVVAEEIQDGQHLLTIGMTLTSASEAVLSAIEERFLASGHPRDLTLIHCEGQSDRVGGIQHLAHEGLVRRIIGSHWGLAPKWMELIDENGVDAYCLPQGQMTHWLRSMASGLPGHLTTIGLGTFVDPRQGGGKMNQRTQPLADLIEVVELKGQEYLWIDAVPIDWVFIRGTRADLVGNVSAEQEAMKLEVLPGVFAARRFNGRVVAQVKEVVARGTLNPRIVEVPGAHVDYVVTARDVAQFHRQSAGWVYDPAFSEWGWDASLKVGTVSALDVRRLIGRRAVGELTPHAIINLGTGIPNDVIGSEILAEGADDLVTVTVESGIYGGSPTGGVNFGIARHPDAIIEHTYQFDFYNGHGVDVTFMGFGEVDARGNVNATKLGSLVTGAGGFIDITQAAKKVVFCGTFTAQGLRVQIDGGELTIAAEGRVEKFVPEVQQVSFNGSRALNAGQQVVIVTERAVFVLTQTGWELRELAPGVDLDRQVLACMGFRPRIARPLKQMDGRIFREGQVGLLEQLNRYKEALS
ncbi:MAG: acyl CoA:acetate/3-ketoacid CoA transferase [Sulfobacillus acidophilus]|uniref:Acyl CoA:acetate/3-ketoacid CoA transferase n=1 Tax=Sulfobacillus acidophilus TaxID=53633 RepID=A0A2T2WJR8_9FIRM|nr:MAG: acyl CoA:acetate/3-ketoacid CoA transferase [Sulfobacillus acidophilus]